MTQEEYEEWRKNKLLYGMHWQRMIDKDTKELLRYNETALRYINGETPQIFASGYNSVVEKVPDSPVGGYDFELVNADTVENIVHEEGIILPKKKLDPEKDVAWNAKLINAQLLQGILQGESIPEMAKRMQTVANSDLAGATRTARTMHTAAQNCGRQTGYNKAAKQGIIFEKTWMAAHDERTRSTHAEMDGQTVAYDAMFVSPSGAELEFPADWRAPAAEVYNCRCTMTTRFKGFKKLNGEEPTKKEAAQQAESTKFTFNFGVDGRSGVEEAINKLTGREREVWEQGINSANYTIQERTDPSDVAYNVPNTRDVVLFSDSGTRTILHETAHSMDWAICTMEYETTGRRKMLDEWIEYEPWKTENKGAFYCAQTIFSMNDGDDYGKSARADLVSIYKWANVMYQSDENPSLLMDMPSSCKDLVKAIREFEKEYGHDAALNLSDMIDGSTHGRFPLGMITGGHGESYWKKNASLEFIEGWAEFAQMKAQKQDDAIEAMRKIMPNKINALEEVYNVVFNGRTYEHRTVTEDGNTVSEEVWRIRVHI